LIKKFFFFHPRIYPVKALICGHKSHSREPQLSRDLTADAGFLRCTAVALFTVTKETPSTICIVPSLGDVFYRDTCHAEI
jgi:hypothetical protein